MCNSPEVTQLVCFRGRFGTSAALPAEITPLPQTLQWAVQAIPCWGPDSFPGPCAECLQA